MMNRIKRTRGLALLGLAFVLASCGPKEITYPETGATLEGTVTYGKEEVTAALVIAQNETSSATGWVGDDGRYRMQNVPLGEINLAVNTAAGKGQAMGKAMAQSQGRAKGPPKLIDVPDKYADPSKSAIKTTINKGANVFDIVIPR
jgi:hypothetical protein